MKTNSVQLRLDDTDFKTLTDEAKKAKISRAELLRVFLHEGLSGYNRQQEEVIRNIRALEEAVLHVNELVALVVTMVAALDVNRITGERHAEMPKHINQGVDLQQAILEAQKKGVFRKKPDRTIRP
jgi:hypothetical protein